MRVLIFIFLVIPSIGSASEFLIVQNIASLTLRAYEKSCSSCPFKLILQTPMIIGKTEIGPKNEDYKTYLGYYEISSWKKFYVDNKESYIPWDGRKLPPKGSTRKRWGWQGAFGVYTAILTPNIGQHLHGTIGWPKESARFIAPELQPDGSLKIIGSKGCTRIENQAIMFLRNLIPENTPVLKIYAKEEMSSSAPLLDLVAPKWTYVFYETKDLKEIFPLNYEHRKKIKEIHILEVGDFMYQNTPSVRPVRDPKLWIKSEINGNPYSIKDSSFKGKFFVDKGVLSKDYSHPSELKVSGKPIPSIFYSP